MNIKVFQNRKIEKDYFYNEGTQNENKSTVLTFEVPLGYEDFSKRIVFITEDGNFWDYVNNNQYEIKNNITKYGKVEAYLWLTKDNQDFRSQNFELNFYENENADNLVPTEEQLDGFATVLDVLELKINEVEELKNTIYQLQENVENALEDLDKKQQDYEQRFQAIDNKLGLKLDEVKANPFVKQVKYDNKSATFTFIAYDNTQVVVDLPIEETVIDGGYDPETQELYLVLVSGQEIRIPATDLVNDYEGLETATIQILISADNKITAHIKGGSITENLLSQEVAAKLNKVIDLTPYITKQESYEVFYTKSEVDEMVKEIQETNEYQSEIIDQFKNEFKQITVSGDSIYIPDAAELPMELVPYGEPVQEVIEAEGGTTVEGESVVVADGDVNKEVKAVINGNSYQETTEGYNLCPTDFDMWESGHYGINGDKGDYSYRIRLKELIPVTPNTTYYIDLFNNSFNLGIREYGKDKNFIKSYGGISNKSTFVSNSETYYLGIFIFAVDMSLNISFEQYQAMFESGELKPFICLNSVSDKSFEQYTGGQASPNTEYKQDIEVITECSLVQRGKNLLDVFNKMSPELSSNGMKYKVNKDGSLSVEGTSTSYSGVYSKGGFNSTIEVLKLKANHKYRFYLFVENKKSDTNTGFYAGSTGNNQIAITGKGNGVFYKDITFVNDLMLNQFSFVGCDASTTVSDTGMILKAMIIDITNGIPNNENFEPYIEPKTIPIDLQGNSLAKVGDVKDLLKIGVNGRVSIEKKIYKDLFDGRNDEKWKFDTTKEITQVFRIENIQKVKAQTFLCNMFTISIKDGDAEKLIRSDTIIFVGINKNRLEENSVQGFKKYLEQNNLVIYNQLAEPETITLPSIEPITLFEGTNVFELVTNLGTTMALTYNYVTPSPSIDRPSEILTVEGSYDTELKNEDASIINTLPLTLTKELLGEIVTLTEEEATALNLDGAGKYRRTDYGRLTDISTMDNYIAPNVVQGFNIKIPNIDNDNANLLMKSNKQKLNTYFGEKWKKYDGNLFGLLYPKDNPKAVYFNKLMENKTISEVKKWWNDNGIELIYPLANPTYEKITDGTELQQLSAYDKQTAFFGINNINTYPTDDLVKAPLKIHATYSKSNKLTIQSLEDRLASLESQVTNLQDQQI